MNSNSHRSVSCNFFNIFICEGFAMLSRIATFAFLLFLFAFTDAPIVHAQTKTEYLTSRPAAPAGKIEALKPGAKIVTDRNERLQRRLPGGGLLYINENTQGLLIANDRLALAKGDVFVKGDTPFSVRTKKRTIRGAGFLVAARDDRARVLATRGQVQVEGLKQTVSAGWALTVGAKPQAAKRVRIADELVWARELMAAGDSKLVPDSKFAGGALVAVDPNGLEMKLELRKYHIDVHIEDGFARTTIDQTYFNHQHWQMEGTFYFPLPPDASLSRLAMYVNGQLMEGGMAERDYARDVYETIRYMRKDPALLEWVDGSTFKMRIFPIEARQEKRVFLSYTQKLPAVDGKMTYRFPAGHSLPAVRHWSLKVRVKGGGKMKWESLSHNLKPWRQDSDPADLILTGERANALFDKDLVLQITDPAKPERARFAITDFDGSKYFLVRLRPDLLPRLRVSAPQTKPRNWLFLFESSGDRDPLLGRVQIDIIRHMLHEANPDDTFNILTANTRVRFWSDKPQPITAENIDKAIAFLERSHLIGALDLSQALTHANSRSRVSAQTYLVHLGTAIPAMGERRLDVLSKILDKHVRYIGVGVGKRWNRNLMKAAAERTGGYFTQINPDESIHWRTFELCSALAEDGAILTRAQIAGFVPPLQGKDAPKFLHFNELVRRGEELAAVIRLDGDMPLPKAVRVRFDDGKTVDLPIAAVKQKAGYLPRQWAKLEIDRLLLADPRGNRDKIVALSKAMYVMSPFTSLLVLENDDMYKQYKVDRGRKDHWALYPAPPKIKVIKEPNPLAKHNKGRRKAEEVVASVVFRRRPGLVAWEPLQFGRGVNTSAGLVGSIVLSPDSLPAPPAVTVRNPETPQRINRFLPSGFMSGLTPAGTFTPDLQVPLRSSSIDFTVPPMGGFRGSLRAMRVGELTIMGNQKSAKNIVQDANGFHLSAANKLANSPTFAMPDSNMPAFGANAWGHLPAGVNRGNNWWMGLTLSPPLGYRLDHSSATTAAVRRMQQLISQSEDYRQIKNQWFRYWMIDQPSHLTYERIHGGIGRNGDLRVSAGYDITGLGSSLDGNISFTTDGNKALSLQLVNPSTPPSLLYARPTYTGEQALFYNLLTYARGLNTSTADALAVLEAEAVRQRVPKRGKIDPAARKLIDRARKIGWRKLTVEGGPAIYFDGQGRFAWQRTLPLGMREIVVCDGKEILHRYPQLHLGAKRAVSRFHRADLSATLPWVVPPAEDLAVDADVRALGANEVAIVPHRTGEPPVLREGNVGRASRPSETLEVRLIFSKDGELAERRIVEMPKEKVLLRQVCSAAGEVWLVDSKGKRHDVFKGALSGATDRRRWALGLLNDVENGIKADPKKLFVMQLPYRSKEFLIKKLKLEKTTIANMPFAGLEQLLASAVAAGDTNHAQQFFQQGLHARNQRHLGYYVLLAACGGNMDAKNLNVLDEHPDSPLAQYLALMSSPVLREHASQWAVKSINWKDPLLQHLATTFALYQRWQSKRVEKWSEKRMKQEVSQALEYVQKHKDSGFGWVMLCLLQDKAGKYKKLHVLLAKQFALFKDTMGYPAKYEEARSLWKGGAIDEARQKFRALYRDRLKEGRLPRIDSDFRTALLGSEKLPDLWSEMMRESANYFTKKKQHGAVFALAWQCRQLSDAPMANQLVASALENIKDENVRAVIQLSAVQFYRKTSQFPEAALLLKKLLDDPKRGKNPALWRLASAIAAERSLNVKSVKHLERAIDLEYQKLPEIINVEQVREDYAKILGHYETLADAMVALKIKPSDRFIAKVIRTADRWRRLDPKDESACAHAAKILRTLDRHDSAWDYMTTPLALQPNEAEPWKGLANELRQLGKLDLADKAFKAAYEAEPTNAQLLWDRAENLAQSGRTTDARKLFRQIAEGRWQPRFQGLVSQAKRRVR